MGSNKIAETYLEAYENFRASAEPRPILVYVVACVSWAAMAAAVALFIALVAQLVGVYPI